MLQQGHPLQAGHFLLGGKELCLQIGHLAHSLHYATAHYDSLVLLLLILPISSRFHTTNATVIHFYYNYLLAFTATHDYCCFSWNYGFVSMGGAEGE